MYSRRVVACVTQMLEKIPRKKLFVFYFFISNERNTRTVLYEKYQWAKVTTKKKSNDLGSNL